MPKPIYYQWVSDKVFAAIRQAYANLCLSVNKKLDEHGGDDSSEFACR